MAAERSHTREIAARIVAGEREFRETLMTLGGISQAEAAAAFGYYVKHRLVKREPGSYRLVVKHGGYLDRDAIRKAAQLGRGAARSVGRRRAAAPRRRAVGKSSARSRKSRGHIAFVGDYEYFDVGGEVFRAHRGEPIADIEHRTRHGRWESSRAHFERFRDQYLGTPRAVGCRRAPSKRR